LDGFSFGVLAVGFSLGNGSVLFPVGLSLKNFSNPLGGLFHLNLEAKPSKPSEKTSP